MAVISKRRHPFLWRLLENKQVEFGPSDIPKKAMQALNEEVFMGLEDANVYLASMAFIEDALSVFPDTEKIDQFVWKLPPQRAVIVVKQWVTVYWISEKGIRGVVALGSALAGVFTYTKSEIKSVFAPFEDPFDSHPFHNFTCGLALLVFSNMSETKQRKLPAKSIVKDYHCKYKNDLPIDVVNWSVNWYTESAQTNPFVVRGHWRLQACGKEMKDRKLKWIDSFMKQGYTKGAYKDN